MSYLFAKSRTRSKYQHAVAILPDEQSGGVRLFTLMKHGDTLVPTGASWYGTEAEAQAEAARMMKVRDTDWTTHDGEPEWAAVFGRALNNAVERYTEAVGESPEDDA